MSSSQTPGRIYQLGDNDILPLSIEKESTTDDNKP